MPAGSNNGFGIKALPGQAATSATTGEQAADGTKYTIVAGFRVFASIADAFDAYGKLLGLGRPYNAMVTEYLKSPRAPADVRALSNALTGVYATAKNYGAALISVQISDNLYQYDQEPVMSDPAASTSVATATNTPATATSPARVTPTVGGQIRVDWGSAAAQFIAHEAPILEAAGAAAVAAGLKSLPFGAIVSTFIGPTLVNQYVGQALTTLEGVLNTQNFSVADSNTLAASVANLINTNEAWLISFIEGNLDPLISKAITALGFPAPSAT
jgi:hypothetical protein